MCFYGFIVLAWVKNFEMKQLGFCILCPYLGLVFFFFFLFGIHYEVSYASAYKAWNKWLSAGMRINWGNSRKNMDLNCLTVLAFRFLWALVSCFLSRGL